MLVLNKFKCNKQYRIKKNYNLSSLTIHNSFNISIDICQIRLDFSNFIIAGPSVTTEAITAGASTMCQDGLTLAVSFETSLLILTLS